MVLIAIAIMLSIAELFTFYGADNLVVPILAALLSLWLL
jgi:dolichol kinase